MTKKITIETLAIMVQKGFEEVVTKKDLKEGLSVIRDELHETREVLAKAIKDLEIHFSASLSHTREEIDHLRNWMEGIEARVSELEKQKHKK